MDSLDDIILLPKSYPSEEELSVIIERYRTLRLTGLEQDPDAFTSTYEAELQFPQERWRSRVTNPDVQTLIAVEKGPNSATPSLSTHNWVGTVTFHGPKLILRDTSRSDAPWNVFLNPEEYTPPQQGTPTTALYMLSGMLVLQEARRNGYGRRMVDKVVQNARFKAEEVKADRMVVFALVYVTNRSACALYTARGFEIWDTSLMLETRDGFGKCNVMALEIELQGR